jgi:hypothetical protein
MQFLYKSLPGPVTSDEEEKNVSCVVAWGYEQSGFFLIQRLYPLSLYQEALSPAGSLLRRWTMTSKNRRSKNGDFLFFDFFVIFNDYFDDNNFLVIKKYISIYFFVIMLHG